MSQQRPSAPERRRGRPRKDEEPVSVNTTLDAALRAFARYGYEGVSLRGLNGELGVSHNVLHQRYGSKANLWRAAADRGFQSFIAEVLSQDDDGGIRCAG